jgi:hypothetical protein
MLRNYLFFWALLGMMGFAGAESALQWDSDTLEVYPSEVDKIASAEFTFTNRSTQPVTIDSVNSSCGCTTATLDKYMYQPGEKGHITAIFTRGRRKGIQTKGISVAVRGEAEATTLTMVTHVPDSTQMDPEFVFWRLGDAPAPKTIQLKVPPGTHVARVSSSDSQILAVLETMVNGSEYRITVTPTRTNRPVMAVLNIQAVSPSNHPELLRAYAQVKPTDGIGH